jgi:hypothetical protein
MIPRYQKIVFAILLVFSVVMGTFLVRQFDRAHERLLRGEDSSPTTAPVVVPEETATLMVANDADGTISAQQRSLPLPKDAEARARALLDRLIELYATPGATHALPATSRPIAQVFLMQVPQSSRAKSAVQESGELAVVNLARAFADSHPSGIATESLTVDSICATLHANLPQVREVRFLVDGESRPTLAGHADLTRTYLIGDATQPAASTGINP